MAESRSRRQTPAARYLPMGYLALAIALAAILLPSILRPPQDLQSETTAFSPDAPPDDTPPESILQSIRSASSSTAGGGTITEEVIVEEVAAPTPPVRKLPSRGRCFGDPPRQTESLYSALCVPAWTGSDNGGKTAPGVYPDEIRIAIADSLTSDQDTPEGRLERDFNVGDTEDTHDLKVWQTYFNERFEFYGRYLQFYIVHQSTTNADQQRGTVTKAKNEFDAFAMIGNASNAVKEAIRQQIIDFGSSNNPVPFYNEAFPYAFAFNMDSWQTRYMATEVACKHYVGKPPGDLNERQDPTFDYDKPRVWGVIAYQDSTRTGAIQMYKDLLERCGAEVKLAQEYNLTDNQQSIGGTMAKMKANGVTTLLLGIDGITPTTLSNEAERIAYYPEYIHAGTGGIDSNSTGRLMEDNQARHIVGVSPNEIARPDKDKDWYRAYKEIDPEGEPSASYFRSLQQLAGGIQHAGPNLNPLSFWDGLSKQPYRSPEPAWAIGGGYRESFGFIAYKDLTYEDFFSLIWFDQLGDDPDSDFTGAWCHVWGGRRFKVGDIPTTPIPWRDNSQCIHAAPEGSQG